MVAYVAKRLVWGAVSFLVLTLATYVLFFQIPADPARFVVRNPRASEQQLAEAREKLGLDDPVLVQYGRYLWRLAHLDFGESFESRPTDVVPVQDDGGEGRRRERLADRRRRGARLPDRDPARAATAPSIRNRSSTGPRSSSC